MSEITTSPRPTKKPLTKTLTAILSIGILLFVYVAGYFILPFSVLSSYHGKNCDMVLSLNKIYTNLYPAAIQDRSFFTMIVECEGYVRAVSDEQNENWQAAFDAYQAYLKTYPDGLYVKDAYEHSAIVLMGLAKDQAAQKKYDEALANLNLIVSTYSDSSVLTDALTLAPSIFTSWGGDLREAGNFDDAEQAFIDFRSWIQNNQKQEFETDALDGLAQTYLEWGVALQSQKQFETALVKLDKAATTAPQSILNITPQAKAAQRKLFAAWGNDLLEQGEFSLAIDKFNLGVSRADGNNEDGVGDALVNGYIEWARQLGVDEDFEGALEKLATADQIKVSDTVKKSVGMAFEDIYLAYSNSSGVQARRAMRGVAMIAICDKRKKPDLPIFGLNADSVRFGMYGVDTQLPDDLIARPGEMHYVVCVKEDGITIDSRYHQEIIQRTANGYYYQIIQQFRAKYVWDVRLLKTDTMDNVGEASFTGGTPPGFSDTGTYFYGSLPEMTEVVKWLESSSK